MKDNMKKILTLGLASGIIISTLTACKVDKDININAEVKVNGEEVINKHIGTGSWEVSETHAVTEDMNKIFNDAVSELDGYYYEPVALLGTQLVSGTNYCFLCRPALSANNAMNSLVCTYIYVDTQGNASFIEDRRVVLPGTDSDDNSGVPVPGGWSYAGSNAVTDDINKIMDKASETLTGAVYIPVAYIGSQVVAGTNHAVLCRMEPSVSGLDSPASLVIVYIYEDLQGNCSISETVDFELGL